EAPQHAEVALREKWITIELRSDWSVAGRTYAAGSLLGCELDAFLAGERSMDVLFEPTPTTSLTAHFWTRHHLVLTVQDDVRDRLEIRTPADGWAQRPLVAAPDVWTITAWPVDSDVSDDMLLLGEDFVTPSSLFMAGIDAPAELLKTTP